MFDNDIPLPDTQHPPFRQMSVGQSVFVPHEGGIMKCKAYMLAATIQKRSRRYKFSGRSLIENGVRGVRIWRMR